MLKPDKCPSMAGKPKLIFAQACRGHSSDSGYYLGRGVSDLQRDGKGNSPAVCIPSDSDILIAYATSPGRVANKNVDYYAHSEPIAHSWFLDALCQVLEAYAHKDDLLSMLTKVNRHVSLFGNSDIGMQVPSQFSTLTKKVFLKKMKR